MNPTPDTSRLRATRPASRLVRGAGVDREGESPMSTDFYQPLRDQQHARLDAMKGTEERVSFCTNVMRDRGTVYDCAINADGNAIVKAARSWWSRSFAPAPQHADRNLGPVSVAIIPGTLEYCLAVGSLREGRG